MSRSDQSRTNAIYAHDGSQVCLQRGIRVNMIARWAQVWLDLYADKLDGRQFDVAACVQSL
jgi:hypothetical protein